MKKTNKFLTIAMFVFLYAPMAVLILVFVCTGIMNRFGGDEEGGVIV